METWCNKNSVAHRKNDMNYLHDIGGENDLGYALAKQYWRQGYASEACRAVVAQLREDGLPYITATRDVNNPRSGEVMKKSA